MTYKIVKAALKTRRAIVHLTKKDLSTVLACRASGDYTAAYNTRLYKRYSGEYCELLDVLETLQPTPRPAVVGIQFI